MTRQLRDMSPSAEPGLVGAMIIGAAALRLVPHPPNFTPALAIALFGGAHLASKRVAIAVPLLAMLASDLALEALFGWGIHGLIPVVYGCIALGVGIGIVLRGRVKPASVALAAFGSSVMFFLVTNFAVWMTTGRYPMTTTGMSECYLAAVPFFRNTLAGTFLYSAGLFGGHALISRRLRAKRQGV
jgi:hypothetical protein